MRFLAFDIESPDGYFAEGNLCEFGYTIADEQFNIIAEKNLLIRPVKPITRPIYRIKLDYPIAVYNSAPTFVEHYERIAKLLSAPDTVVVGHAIHNDIFCVNSALARNTLRYIDFKFVDTQILYSIYKEEKSVMSLDKIACDIGEEFTHHRADEDARMSLLTLKYICNQEQLSYKDLLEKYEAVEGTVTCGMITNFMSNKIANIAPSLDSKNSKRRLISSFLPEVNKTKFQPKHILYKKKVAIDSNLIIENVDDSRSMIQALVDIGARYITGQNNLDYYVTNDDSIEHAIDNVKLLTLVEFKEILGHYEQLKFDNQAILNKYMKERLERRRKEATDRQVKKLQLRFGEKTKTNT